MFSAHEHLSVPDTHPAPNPPVVSTFLQCFAKYQRISCGISLGGLVNPNSTEGQQLAGERGAKTEKKFCLINKCRDFNIPDACVRICISI